MLNISEIRKIKRYSDFIFLNKPEKFKDLFNNKTYDCVQVHDLTPIGGSDVVGFAGQFSWHENKIKSLDGDSYTSGMSIYGYKEFTFEDHEEILLGLDILVEEW